MTPVVRVDDEVWEWLKTLARPLEDTPNSVLRRVARIDPPIGSPIGSPIVRVEKAREPARETVDEDDAPPPSPALEPGSKRITGEWLNRAFRLDARHALYHKDGTFFERLARFPGVLCDRNGSVRFEDEAQFLADPALSVGEKVNVPHGLSSHPRYQRFQAVARR